MTNPTARLRLERRFADLAVEQFGIPARSYRLLSRSHIAKFLVESDSRFLLRLHQPSWHSVAMIASELQWLTALRRQTSLPLPTPVATADGRTLLELRLPVVARQDLRLLLAVAYYP